MAVSKTQNERPAIIALIDAVNETEPIVAQNVQDIAALNEGLGDEISNRESADGQLHSAIESEVLNRVSADANIQNQIGEGFSSELTIAQSLNATNSAVESVDDKIGDGVFSSSFTVTQGFQQAGAVIQNMNGAIDVINQWQDRFKFGLTSSIAVAANSTTSSTVSFESPFANDAEVTVFPACVGGSETLTNLSCKLISADYLGFSFSVVNNSEEAATIKVGYLAVRMN